MAKITQKARQRGSKLKAELQAGMDEKVERARKEMNEADARLVAAADKGDEAGKAASLADRDRATADLERYEKGAAALAGDGTMAEALIENGLSADSRVVVTVIGPAKGRRRAGYQFGANPVTVAVTPAELELIEADAELAVTPGLTDAVAPAGAPAERLPVEAFMDGDTVRPVKVLGPAKGRRRAGHLFGAQAVTLSPTRAELEMILGDAELSVTPA